MKSRHLLWLALIVPVLVILASCATSGDKTAAESQKSLVIAKAQVPAWSRGDMDFFLHGSMGAEVVPEAVLRAFMATYPDLFPSPDLSHLGLIPDPAFGWPVGFSRRKVPHLGGLSSVGVNCASCHVAEFKPAPDAAPVRVLGVTSHFDAEAFFGSVIVATFRTADPTNMHRFMANYLSASDPVGGNLGQAALENQWQRQETNIIATMSADPAGANGVGPGALQLIGEYDVWLVHQRVAASVDLAEMSHSMLKLFHNMRAAVHFPDQPPAQSPPPSGPGRNDAFGLLSAELFGVPKPYAPVKYGLVWNLEKRHWVHWDGNTQSPVGRNLIAALGLGAPMIGKQGLLDFAVVQRQTDLSEKIHAPKYPFAVDAALAKRGAAHYRAKCASCHDGVESDVRLHSPAEIGTQPLRAESVDQAQADRFNQFFAELEIHGYRPPSPPAVRSTQKYWSPSLAGVWLRAPYLHNGSVRTVQELLTPPAARAKSFHRGSRIYDATQMGYADEGVYVLDTITVPGNSNAGHDYGTDLSAAQKLELMEYLKTL